MKYEMGIDYAREILNYYDSDVTREELSRAYAKKVSEARGNKDKRKLAFAAKLRLLKIAKDK